MKIKLENFKCYVKSEFDLPDNGLVLLNGESGVGKTSLINAIVFCFYGNLRKITNFLHPNAKTSVEITNDNLKINIYRQKKPDLLRVTYKCENYEGDEAQSIIDRIFGNEIIFHNGSYVKQNSRCALLQGSSNERMDHISHFAFERDTSFTPLQIKEAIQKSISSKEKESSIEQALFAKCNEEYMDAMSKIVDTTEPPNSNALSTDLEDSKIIFNNLNKSISLLESEVKKIAQDRSDLNSLEILKKDMNERVEKAKSLLVDDVTEEVLLNIKTNEKIENDCYNSMQKFLTLNEEYKILEPTVTNVALPAKTLQDAESSVSTITLDIKKAQAALRDLNAEFIKCGEANAKLQTIKDYIIETNKEIEEEEKITSTITATESDIIRTEKLLYEYTQKLKAHQDYILSEEKKANLHAMMSKLSKFESYNLVDLQYQIEICKRLNSMEVKDSVDKLYDVYIKTEKEYEENKGELLKCPECSTKLLYRDNGLHYCPKTPNPKKPPLEPLKLGIITTKKDWVASYRILEKTVKEDQNNEGIKHELVKLKNWLETANGLLSKRIDGTTLESLEEDIKHIHDYNEIKLKYESIQSCELPSENLTDCKKHTNILTEELKKYRTENAMCESSKKRLQSLKSRLSAHKREAEQLSVLRHPKTVEADIFECNKNISKLNTSLEDNNKLINFWNKYLDFVAKSKILNDLKNKIQIHIDTLKKYKRQNLTLDEIKKNYETIRSQLDTLLIQREKHKATNDAYIDYLSQLKVIEDKIKNINFDDELFDLKKKELDDNNLLLKNVVEKIEFLKSQIILREKYDLMESRKSSRESKQISIDRCSAELESLYKLKDLSLMAESQVLLETVDNINKVMYSELQGLFESEIKVVLETSKQLKSKDARKFQLNCNVNYKGFNYDDISSLSGGEGDRVSLAMVCALNRIIGSHFLILDESISSMDSELKINVLESLKSLGMSRLILIVNHDGIVGAFDKVINI